MSKDTSDSKDETKSQNGNTPNTEEEKSTVTSQLTNKVKQEEDIEVRKTDYTQKELVVGFRQSEQFRLEGRWLSTMTETEIKVISLVRQRRFVKYSHTLYFYSSLEAMWLPIYSTPCGGQLCSTFGINAPVNYLAAIAPYLNLIDTNAVNITNMPESYCIGNRRLRLKKIKNSSLSKAVSVKILKISSTSKAFRPRYNEFSMLSLKMNVIPAVYKSFPQTEVEDFMIQVLGEAGTKVMMWSVGHGLRDPVEFPHCILMSGISGGEGKSSVINLLYAILDGCIEPLSKDPMYSQLPERERVKFLSCRFLTYSDTIFPKGMVNASLLKNMFGGDIIEVAGSKVKSSAVLILASNSVWIGDPRQLYPWRVRRMGCLAAKRDPNVALKHVKEVTDEMRAIFIARCIRIRCKYPRPPYNIEQVLYTLFGSWSHYATRGIVYKDDATFMECSIATWSLSICGGVEYERLILCVDSMNPDLTMSRFGEKVIKGLYVNTEMDDERMDVLLKTATSSQSDKSKQV